MLRIMFIRHGKTATNVEGRITGRTDYPLLPEAVAELTAIARDHPYPPVDALYTSPLARCLQTVECFFPGRQAMVIPELTEVSFGDLEGKNLRETFAAIGRERIARYDPTLRFPHGESLGDAAARMVAAIDTITDDAVRQGFASVGVVTHSMVLGAFLKHHAVPALSPADISCPNGLGIDTTVEPEQWRHDRRIHFQGLLPEGVCRDAYGRSH